MKKLSFIILYIFYSSISAQVDPNTLLGLPGAAKSDIDLTTPSVGSMVYDATNNEVYVYTGSTFEKVNIGPQIYIGSFQISAAGTLNITDVPFQPSSITFKAYANVEDFNIDGDNETGNNDRGIDNSFGSMFGFARNDAGTISQQVIYDGGHGNSINDIARFASNTNCIGIRFGDQNGNSLGKITGSLTSFDSNGFEINVAYTNGTITVNNANALIDVQPDDINNEGLLVIYTAYR